MRTIKFTALLLAITAMVSCQKENIDTPYNSDPSAVKLTAAVGSPFTRSNPLSDGAASAAFKSGDVIAVSAGTQGEVKYTLNVTSWTPESGKYHKWESDAMTFTAYYPVGANNASLTSFNVPIDQSTLAKIEQADYMTFSGSLTKPTTIGEAVSFALTRRTAHVVVDNITFNDQYATGYTVTKVEVISNTNGYADGSVKVGNVQVQSYAQDGKFYALLSPTIEAPNAVFFAITIKKTEGGDETILIVKGIPALEAGKSYAYTVIVGKNVAEITNVTVEDWITGTAIPGGEAELMATIAEQGIAAPRIYVVGTGDDARLMLTKAPTNPGVFFKYGSLIAIKTPDNGYDYDNPATEMVFNPTTTSSFYPWANIPYADEAAGINADYHTVANATAGKGDPCRLVGYTQGEVKAMLAAGKMPDNHQWRLPTEEDNIAFVGGESSYNPGGLVSVDGVSGLWFPRDVSKANGFLPTAGYLDGNGLLKDVGVLGRYWSSLKTSDLGARHLYFNSGNVYQTAIVRPSGLLIRCVPQ